MAILNGTTRNDTINGTSDDDVISGFGGDDSLRGNRGNDTLYGGAGYDVLQGGDGNDILMDSADGAGFLGDAGNDLLIGSASLEDSASYFFFLNTSGVTFFSTFAPGAATSTQADGLGGVDTLMNIDRLDVVGSQFDDNIVGDAGDNVFIGLGGNDILSGRAGNDFLLGFDNDDTLVGGAGDDILDGGTGIDTASFEGLSSEYTVTFNATTSMYVIQDKVVGRDGRDTVSTVEFFRFSNETVTAANLIAATTSSVVSLSLSTTSIAEGNSGNTSLTFTISLSTAAASPVTVSYTTANGTATAGSDYTATSGILTFAAGETSKTISVAVLGDTTVEANETFTLSLSNPSSATLGATSTTTATIINDDTVISPPTQSNLNDFVVLQPSTPAVAGAGVGNDVYLLSGSMIPAGKAITISDSIGSNTLQLAPGLSVASSQVSATALKLTLSNGASVTVLGADKFSYDMGGNLSAGLNPPDLTYSQFVQNNLGTTIPTSGVVNGSALNVGSGPMASLLASTASGNDFIVAQVASPAIIGGGVGNDTYLLAPGLLPAGTNLTISDAQGANSIQLASGLQIASAQVGATALKLNLTSGASVTVLGADRFTFEAGGNTTAGIDQPDLSYSQFLGSVLGVSVPTTGLITSGAVTIGGSTIGVTGNQVVNATAAAEVFSFNVASALADVAGTNTQATISGFSTANDRLVIDLITANSSLTRLDQLSGVQGVFVATDPFTPATIINFGNDANGGHVVVLTLVGVSDPSAVQIQVV